MKNKAIMMWSLIVFGAVLAACSSPDDPLVVDARSYATDQGISLDEAIDRLELQGYVGELEVQLTANEKDTFAGLWIQHEPEFRVIVQFTHGGEERLSPYLKNSPIADIVEVRTASVSLVALENAQAAALRAVRDLGLPVESGINVFENRVELYVTDRARFEELLERENLQLPASVEVIEVDELSTAE